MYVIGLTGGIASGKSTVSAILKKVGAYIIDIDKIAYDITLPQQPAWHEIIDCFGKDILMSDGHIDRKRLGEIVFKDEILRRKLEEITHPKIKRRLHDEIKTAQNEGCKLVVLDVPLLIEVGWSKIANEIWVVYVDDAEQLKRLKLRNGLTTDQALDRIRSQMNLRDKIKYADVIIDNNSSIKETESQVIKAWHRAEQIASGILRGSNNME